MESRSRRPSIADFVFQCLCLGTPLARVVVIGTGIGVLAFVDASSLKLPDICIWDRLLGVCPAEGTTRALSAFLHGRWHEAFRYNVNILATVPLIAALLTADIGRLASRGFRGKKAGDNRDGVS